MTAFSSSMQGRFRAILIRAVNVGTMIKQELHRFLVPVFGGFTQGGTRMAPIVVWFVNIAVIFEEEPRGPRFGQEPSRPPLAARGMRHAARPRSCTFGAAHGGSPLVGPSSWPTRRGVYV